MDKRQANKAMFQLRSRLAKLRVKTTLPEPETLLDSDDGEEGEPEPTPPPPSPAVPLKSKLPKVKLSRRWTHNEQLFVRCCGIIVARATFFGSEAISGVKVSFLHSLFELTPLILARKDFLYAIFPPEYPSALPTHIFFDNNCQLRRHLVNIADTRILPHVGLPVDVFHFKSKHKETDIHCQTYCNPANFPELMTSEDEWLFNSSAAEQVNVWFGAFQSIVREMTVERYNFYLDEVIAIRNRYIASLLSARLHAPHLLTEPELRWKL